MLKDNQFNAYHTLGYIALSTILFNITVLVNTYKGVTLIVGLSQKNVGLIQTVYHQKDKFCKYL